MTGKTLHELARAQFAEARKALLCYKVPEWGDAPIYFYASQNHQESSAISRHVDEKGQMDPDVIITTIMMRCRDENGARLFSKGDERALRTKYDPIVLQKIAGHIAEHTVLPEGGEKRKKK